MVCIIKKGLITPDGISTMEIVYKSNIFPCKVNEIEDENKELKNYLAMTFGPGKYYVYMFGGEVSFRKYFNGIVTMGDDDGMY